MGPRSAPEPSRTERTSNTRMTPVDSACIDTNLGILLPREKWLEVPPSARALKIQGDAGEGTRWVSSPKAFAVVPAPDQFSEKT